MRKRFCKLGTRVVSFFLAMMWMATPAFAIVREVNVYGVKSINDLGHSDQRVTMDMLKEDYSDFVQTDTLREYFHQDQGTPTKTDLSVALSWLIDNNIISRDQKITVSNVGDNQIPKVDIQKFDTSKLRGMDVMRIDLLMYTYKAAFGPIYARSVGVETDNVRVDDGEYITLADLMKKNGYTTDPSNTLAGSGSSTTPGGGGSGNGAGANGSTEQSNYINDQSNWRYQPQGDLWESIFGDTNIFISQNNFQQGITGGNGGGGGGGGAGIGSGGSGGATGNTAGNQTQVNTGNVGSIQGSDDTMTSTNSNNITGTGNPVTGAAGTTGNTGSGSASFSSGTGGAGGAGGSSETGDNTINYETDYKQIYFIPGADLLLYNTSDVPEVYVQEALAKGLLDFEDKFRNDNFTEKFVTWKQQAENKNKLRSWDGGSPAYIVNRTRNVLKTVSNTEQVPLAQLLGNYWNVSWQNNTLTIERTKPFEYHSGGFFTTELITKMDVYEYIYHFIQGSEKVLSELESDIVNYKYGMELEGITDDEGTKIIKYLIAKGIINYEVTNEFMGLDTAISWDEFLMLIYRVANKDARYDFSQIQLTDSETQWKAKGYSPQTTYLTPGNNSIRTQIASVEEYSLQNFGTRGNVLLGTTSDGLPSLPYGYTGATYPSYSGGSNYPYGGSNYPYGGSNYPYGGSSYPEDDYDDPYDRQRTGIPGVDGVASTTDSSGRTRTMFGDPGDKDYIWTDGNNINEFYFYSLTANLEGAVHNSAKNNGEEPANVAEAAKLFNVAAPSTNMGKYVISLLYDMTDMPTSALQCTWTKGYTKDSPKFELMRNVTCNIWAGSDMRKDSASKDEVKNIFQAIADIKGSDADALVEKLKKKTNLAEFQSAVAECQKYFTYTTNGSVIYDKFQFTDNSGHVTDNTNSWVSATGGDVKQLVDTFTGVEMHVKIDNVMTQFIMVVPKSIGVSRSLDGSEHYVWETPLEYTLAQVLDNPNLTEEQKTQMLLTYDNNITTFYSLEAINNTPLITYIEPNTSECYISWSTIEKYRQTSSSGENSLPIKKISDFLLYNEETATYAYFNNTGDDKRALVGTDVVTCNNDYGVAYREGSEMYYLIDAIRLLMDSKQESSLLGGIRSMPLASLVVQENLTKVSIDNNDGTPANSLTGVCVLLSDDDAKTSENITDKNSVYFTDTNNNQNARWGNFLAISQSNRAINAVSRQISYTGKNDTKLTAYAVVIFEPLSASDMGYTGINSSSSLQDLLDAPMQQPESEADQERWQRNKLRCNLLANWIYGTANKEYISTGYMEPHAYLYSTDPDIVECLSDSDWGVLTTVANKEAGVGSERELVEVVRLYLVNNGAIDKFGTVHSKSADEMRADPEHKANYLLSADYKLCILGNRAYLNLGCFKNMQKIGPTKLKARNLVVGSAAFTVGSTFKSAAAAGVAKLDGHPVPKATVIKTETNGMVTCQVGPIYGMPLLYGTENTGIIIHDHASKTGAIQDIDWSTAANNQIQWMFEYLFQPTGQPEVNTYEGIELLGISTSPVLATDSSRNYVFDGSQLITYKGTSRTSKGQAYSLVKANPASKVSDLANTYKSGWAALSSSPIVTDNVEAYFNIKFNAFNFTVENGVLKYHPNQASDYISPSLFTSLNDLIIDGIINESNGAIPIEQVPFGSIVEIGTGWYVSYGTSEDDISFVGYAPLDGFPENTTYVTVQDAAKSFATQFIRAGNQQLNISHFFDKVEVPSLVGNHMENLKILNESKMAVDTSTSKKYMLGAASENGSSASGDIYISAISGANVNYYALTNVSFQKGIVKAYKTSEEGVEPAEYVICTTADTAVSGPLSDLPFFSNNALDGAMSDRTTSANSGGFTPFYGAEKLMSDIRLDFQKGFAGDLFTLARMIVFIILVWLVVASWLCYGTYFGGLMPILDAIKHPTGDRSGKGVDLMKIISLGSISMETDFKLGRFIQYNLVLAALLCVVYISGIYM